MIELLPILLACCMVGGLIFYQCGGTENADTYLLFKEPGVLAMDLDCCCCPTCSYCVGVMPPYCQVTWSGVQASFWGTGPNDKDCDYCNVFNSTYFELTCHPSEACTWSMQIPAGNYCGYDRIIVKIHYDPYSTGYGYWVEITDDESSPVAWAFFFDDTINYGVFKCIDDQTPPFEDEPPVSGSSGHYYGDSDACVFQDSTCYVWPACTADDLEK